MGANTQLIEHKPSDEKSKLLPKTPQHKTEKNEEDNYHIVWHIFLWLTFWHLCALYGLFLVVTLSVSWKTTLWSYVTGWLCLHAALGGGHRLWAHRSYKAKLPLKIFYIFFQTMALIFDLYDWVRDHRIHHKYSDTYADPYSTKRGYFNAHVGWLFFSKHKSYLEKLKTMDMRDLEADPLIVFQRKYYPILALLIGVVLPIFVPVHFWGEDLINCTFVALTLKQTIVMHMIFIINSFAHKYGNRPIDKNLFATQNKTVSIFSLGEGWHNFHHVFPWDFRAGEYGNFFVSPTTKVIELMAKIGWAYDLKTASDEMIQKRVLRTGDGTKIFNKNKKHDNFQESLWGWGDSDMKSETKQIATVLFKNVN